MDRERMRVKGLKRNLRLWVNKGREGGRETKREGLIDLERV